MTVTPRRQATLDFMVRCRAAESADEIGALLFGEMAACGIAYVACASHVDPLHPPSGAVALVNYPETWLVQFSKGNYAACDPVFLAARRSTLPFQWDDVLARRQLSAEQRRILDEARSCGVKGGLTIPIHTPGAFAASCSLVPGDGGVDPALLPDLQFMAIQAHEEARLRLGAPAGGAKRLTAAERQCLSLAATGKSDWVIAQILGKSPRTVHHLLESAKRRFGVSHRIQAVMHAILSGEIAYPVLGPIDEDEAPSS